MKESELRKIIKEEISNTLSEGGGMYSVEGKFEIRGKDINNDGNLFYSLYLNGKQIGPDVIKNGGITTGKDFEETLRKFIK